MLYFNSRRISKTLNVCLLVLLPVIFGGCYSRAQPPRTLEQASMIESDFYYSNGKPISVSVALDQIGVLVKESISSERLKVVAERFDLTVVREINGSIFILGLPDAKDRLPLAQFAREFKEQNADLVAKAGLVITLEKADVPMVMTDEFVAHFKPKIEEKQIEELNNRYSVEVIMENPFLENQFLLRITEKTEMTALELSNRYEENEITEYAHPNFIQMRVPRQAIPEAVPNDELFPNQWHHRNTGQMNGTPDADIDSTQAWAITAGQPNVTIAVIDFGFDMGHPDLTPNYWKNPGEIAGDGIDNDGNTLVDDVNGWDFTGCDASSEEGCGDNDLTGPDTSTGARHGTAVAGSAAASGDNIIGVTGSCQNCTIMLLRISAGGGDFSAGLAFSYAQKMGANIISNSWGYPSGIPAPTAVVTAVGDATANGAVVLWAMNNAPVNDCDSSPDISSLVNVIAISSATNQDQFDLSGFGNCMDLLAPSAHYLTVQQGRGTLWVTTTDMMGNAGYNKGGIIPICPSTEASPPPANAMDYTACFRGTSFATPLTAGAVGLMLSARPSLTRVQVQRLLQDTADKIEHSTARYDQNTGFSAPTTGDATHGWGRINAFEAVRVAAPADQGGKAGTDIFLRDNSLDWGNTEQPSNTLFEPTRGFIGHWRSMDIKVDAPNPYQAVPTTSVDFDALTDETPSAITGDINRVYIRVRNRGPETASSVTVKLHWTQFGTALPSLPLDFWTAFPADSSVVSQWHSLGVRSITNLKYSGSSYAGCPGRAQPPCTFDLNGNGDIDTGETIVDNAQIVQFDFPAPAVDPMLPNHFCLLGIIDSPQDKVLPKSRPTTPSDFVVDTLTPTDNNVTHRNYKHLPTNATTTFQERFFVRNPTPESIQVLLRLAAPDGWKVGLEKFSFNTPFRLRPNSEMLVSMSVIIPKLTAKGEVTVIQEQVKPRKVMGGITYIFRSIEKPAKSKL